MLPLHEGMTGTFFLPSVYSGTLRYNFIHTTERYIDVAYCVNLRIKSPVERSVEVGHSPLSNVMFDSYFRSLFVG